MRRAPRGPNRKTRELSCRQSPIRIRLRVVVEFRPLEAIQPEPSAGELQVRLDVGGLPIQLVRLHLKTLDQLRVELDEDQPPQDHRDPAAIRGVTRFLNPDQPMTPAAATVRRARAW